MVTDGPGDVITGRRGVLQAGGEERVSEGEEGEGWGSTGGQRG